MALPTPVASDWSKTLSLRERQLLGMAAAGLLDKQIAQELGLSQNTLRTYWRRVRNKVGDMPKAALVSAFVKDDLANGENDNLEQLPIEGVIIDVPTGTMLAADSVNDMHGLAHGVPHPLVAYSHIYHPEDREQARRVIYDVIEGRTDSAHVTFRLVPDTGVEIISVSFQSVRDANGNVSKVYGYRVRALDCRSGRSPDVKVGTWTRWTDLDELTVDNDLADMLQLPGAGTYSRETVYERIHPDDRAANRCAAELAASRGETRFQQDARILGADGEARWMRTRGHLVEVSDGRTRVVGDAMMFQ